MLTDTLVLRSFLDNVNFVLSRINEPVVHIINSGKEFSIVVEEVV